MAGNFKNSSAGQKLGLLPELIRNAQLAWRLLRDPRVSRVSKFVIPALAGAYFLSPIDLLPDLIPVLTQLDDVAVMALALKLFIDMAPPSIVQQHLREMVNRGAAGETVDADYRVVE